MVWGEELRGLIIYLVAYSQFLSPQHPPLPKAAKTPRRVHAQLTLDRFPRPRHPGFDRHPRHPRPGQRLDHDHDAAQRVRAADAAGQADVCRVDADSRHPRPRQEADDVLTHRSM